MKIFPVRPALQVAVLLAAGSVLVSCQTDRPRVVLQTELTWGTSPSDSAATRHLPFEVKSAGGEYRLVVQPLRDRGQSGERPAHLRARILRPNGTHLVGMDFRLFVNERKTILGRSQEWPEGSVAFQPDTTGRHILQVERHESDVRRARVRIVGPIGEGGSIAR